MDRARDQKIKESRKDRFLKNPADSDDNGKPEDEEIEFVN